MKKDGRSTLLINYVQQLYQPIFGRAPQLIPFCNGPQGCAITLCAAITLLSIVDTELGSTTSESNFQRCHYDGCTNEGNAYCLRAQHVFTRNVECKRYLISLLISSLLRPQCHGSTFMCHIDSMDIIIYCHGYQSTIFGIYQVRFLALLSFSLIHLIHHAHIFITSLI